MISISSCTLAEEALITANWLNLTNEQFQCEKIEEGYSKRSDAEIVIKMHRIKHGCGVLSPSVKVEVGYIGYHSCLCYTGYKYPLMGCLLQLRDAYEKGILPYDGGVMNQPAQVIELISLMQRLFSEYELENHKKQMNNKG